MTETINTTNRAGHTDPLIIDGVDLGSRRIM